MHLLARQCTSSQTKESDGIEMLESGYTKFIELIEDYAHEKIGFLPKKLFFLRHSTDSELPSPYTASNDIYL